jgi:hypothetical protein
MGGPTGSNPASRTFSLFVTLNCRTPKAPQFSSHWNGQFYLLIRPPTIVHPGFWFHVACSFGANGSKLVCAFGPVFKSVCAFGPVFHRLYEDGAATVTPTVLLLGCAEVVFPTTGVGEAELWK